MHPCSLGPGTTQAVFYSKLHGISANPCVLMTEQQKCQCRRVQKFPRNMLVSITTSLIRRNGPATIYHQCCLGKSLGTFNFFEETKRNLMKRTGDMFITVAHVPQLVSGLPFYFPPRCDSPGLTQTQTSNRYNRAKPAVTTSKSRLSRWSPTDLFLS